MTSHPDPFGPPPTEPPRLGATPTSAGPSAPTHLAKSGLAGQRTPVIWAGALATIGFAGLTGFLLDSRWSYLSLGAALAALLLVVLGVSTPPIRPDDVGP